MRSARLQSQRTVIKTIRPALPLCRPPHRDPRLTAPRRGREAAPAPGGELTYLSGRPAAQDAPAASDTTSEYFKTLPEWAQRFLQQNAEPGSGAAAHQTAPAGQQPPRQIEWTAPNAVPAGTPHIVFKEQAPKETAQPPQAPRLSDSELRRAADKVYHMIEERLRKELRRSGR